MTIPEFIDCYHLPPEIIECTFEEIEEKFLFSPKREEKWECFKRMLDRMISLGLKPEKILINGSFVTGRSEPGDVDFAALILPETIKEALAKAEDSHDREGILRFLKSKNQEMLRDLFGAHLLVADSEPVLTAWANTFMKGLNGKLREPNPKKDPEWVTRPEIKGILSVSL